MCLRPPCLCWRRGATGDDFCLVAPANSFSQRCHASQPAWPIICVYPYPSQMSSHVCGLRPPPVLRIIIIGCHLPSKKHSWSSGWSEKYTIRIACSLQNHRHCRHRHRHAATLLSSLKKQPDACGASKAFSFSYRLVQRVEQSLPYDELRAHIIVCVFKCLSESPKTE